MWEHARIQLADKLLFIQAYNTQARVYARLTVG